LEVETGSAAFLALHDGPGFVLPNAWDAGSARTLEQVGFPALATTSAGIAWSLGLPDGGDLDVDTMLEHVGRIVAAVSVPVSADLEDGYAATSAGVADTVRRALDVGVVGANIEDFSSGHLLPAAEGAARIGAARAAAPAGTFVINARTDTYFSGFGGSADEVFGETVARCVRYLDAGADCVFVPAVRDAETIERLCAAIPGPVNIVAGLANTLPPAALFELGVQRVSIGGGIARAALSFVERAGRELLDGGTLGFLDGAVSYADLQERMRG
jgi:2-methylisocitrate lyase-like PEP mutase family enzyme